jgi:hypothetical protein
LPNIEVTAYFETVSAKILPAHILFPFEKGKKLIGCLFFPDGVRYSELSGSNLSGWYSSGLYHSFGFLNIAP